ncbi:MAG: Stk1 family PASTA domain-containing Ser/Thr kinase [Nocardioidaceae bacterium]
MDRVTTSDPLVGQLLDGRYRVTARIARGGMATVYEATDLRLDRPVALKVMAHSLADNDEFSQRFVREARAAARLTHPSVVGVYDQGDDDGVLFLAMEYVPGRHTLRDLIRSEAPLPPGRALALLEPILEAIAAAHESGIIHRDIKPENVLLTPAGKPKVADFGLARAVTSATSATATSGVLLGTVSYLPPELVTDGTSDARSDVYALGVMLFEMLTGTKPHAGDTPIQVAYKHVHDDVPPPSSLVDDIPPYLDAFVARATARRRDLRPADAHVMLQQLRRVRHAYDSGISEDTELTEDLTPTIAVTTGGDDYRAPDSSDRTGDEVFDISAYDDFAGHPGPSFHRPGGREHTLVVGHDTVEDPLDAADPGGGSTPSAGGQGEGRVRPAPRRRRARGWIAFILVLLLAIGAGIGGWWYGVARFQSTPDVVRMSQSDARGALDDAGLDLQITGAAFSETIPGGHIISTDPDPGDRVLDHGTVEAVVSKGPERYDVPDLSGSSESEAIALLTERNLEPEVSRRLWSEQHDEGQVIRFSPEAGTALKRDATVTMVVSKGPRPIDVRGYEGEPVSTARDELEAAGLKVRVVEQYNDDVAEGLVIRQWPNEGQLYRGNTVRLVVSLGPHLVEVPDVKGYGEDSARDALEEAGFEVDFQDYQPSLGFHIVADQSPGGGDMAPFGSTIVVYLI